MVRHVWLLSSVAVLLCGCGTQALPPVTPATTESKAAPVDEAPDVAARSPLAVDTAELGEYRDFPASGVKLRQPLGFEASASFDGFGQPESQSSVMAITIPGPLSKTTAGFTDAHMKKRGWTLLSKQDVDFDDSRGILVHFEQPAGGVIFLKWAVVFGDERSTTMITAAFPKTLEAELSDRLKAAVLSARKMSIDAGRAEGAVPFALGDSAKLKLASRANRTLTYTKDGVIPLKSLVDPLFIVTSSLGVAAVGDKQQFAERRLLETAQVKGVSTKSCEPVTIDHLEGFETLAEAADAQSDVPMIVYQIMLFDGKSYILMQGLVGDEQRDVYVEEFQSLARTFRRKP